MNVPTVVALGHRFPSLEIERKVLSGVAIIVDGNALSAEQLPVALETAGAVLLGTRARVDVAQIDAMRECRVIARYGVGVDNIAVERATRRGILVTNVPDYCVEEVSDHAIALLLAASRRLDRAQASMRSGQWGTGIMKGVQRLCEQTAGIVGFGRIGQAAARKVRPFVRTVLAFDPVVPAETIAAQGAEPVDLPTLLRSSDYVSLHCPLFPETEHLINADTLRLVRPGAWLVNTSRGELVDEGALIDALAAHRLGGAALDVFGKEPVPGDSRLFGLDNVILTPHVAWYSERALEDLQRLAAEQVCAVLQGKRPQRLCNPGVLESKSVNKDGQR